MTVESRVTRVLLACGAVGAPFSLVVFHLDAVTRPGYELLRHGPSLLMTGDWGWIQITNFVVTGILMLACAVGLRRTLVPGLGSSWGPLLMVAYGLGMICTGVFVTDPQLGFPPGAPQDLLPGVNAEASWHGNVHTVSVLFMYASLTAACFVFARRFAAEPGGRWWAASLVATGVAAPTVLIVGAFIFQTLSLSSQWIAVADGVAGRVIIPLGWIWAALVPARMLATLTQPSLAFASAAPDPRTTRPNGEAC
ncbi:DUF998 domain-containing protein [Actinoplanes sp. NEAU-A12]|uniref:DUF998 domain-containing protein n=1 Tax=Actinoplanes sandaracinus TaxID=3045177 RepID=A0ABT6X1Y1_9ACTN|nr:DUF998 domain-containing protein [Actinoplanes sandaracinus]MDI6106032.1 DUF998 domain-containing protein [Actinoplanes sandaracinus]